MEFNIYHITNLEKPLKKNVSKEKTIEYLKSLTMTEKAHIYLEPIKEKTKDEEER